MPSILLLARVLLVIFNSALSPPDYERTSFFAVSPAPSRVHATVWLSSGPTVWNYFAHQVPCREQEYHFGGVQVWTTFHEVVLRVGSRGICSGAHQRPGYCLPIAFPAMVTSLRWGWGVFGDVRKGSFLNTLFLGSIFRERLLGWGNELFPGFLRFPWSHCLRRGVGLFTQRCGRGVSTDYKVSTYLGCVSTWDWHLLFWGAFSGG